MKILSLKSKSENDAAPQGPPTVGPARAAFDAHRARAEALTAALAEKLELAAAVKAAAEEAESKVAAAAALRERITACEARIQGTVELGGSVVDASELADLRHALTVAEREATAATPRVRVEKYKLSVLAAEIATLTAAQRDAHAEHAPLAFEVLWEDLAAKAATLTASRAAYVAAHDAAFAVAKAIDLLATALKNGRFAHSGAAGELVLPTVPGMDELPYTAQEHAHRIATASTDLLVELGVASR